MILGFHRQFVDPILEDRKKHSIREDRHDRWKTGIMIHFSIGVRTKGYKCFKKGPCVSTQRIRIEYRERKWPHIFIDDRELDPDQMEVLARNDGFENMKTFFCWFNKDFKGKIIHWTDLKY